jgi:hypothetical protein
MTSPTYSQLEQAVSLLFHSYVKTIDAIQNEWGGDLQLDDRATRTMNGLFNTLERDAVTHKAAPITELVGALAMMNLIESGNVEAESGFGAGILSQE